MSADSDETGVNDRPIPFEFFVQLVIDDLGLSRRDAEDLVRESAALCGVLTTENPQ